MRACHDLSEGGLGVAAAEMCIGGRLGLDLQLAALPGGDPLRACLAKPPAACWLRCQRRMPRPLRLIFRGLHCLPIGAVSPELSLRITHAQQTLLDLPVDSLLAAWRPEID